MKVMLLVILLLVVVVTRLFQVYYFIKHISKICHMYDWMYVDDNVKCLFEIMQEKYYLKSEWSAYNFLYLKGPSFTSMFFSTKPLTIEKQYSKEAISKINEYEFD
jgi:hypothetical protein